MRQWIRWALVQISDDVLSPIRRQAIISTNDGLLSDGPLRKKFSEMLVKNQIFLIQENAFEWVKAWIYNFIFIKEWDIIT